MITSEENRTYEVIFIDEDRVTVLKDLTTLNHSDCPNPSKQNTEEWEYAFLGWFDQNLNHLQLDTPLQEDMIYTAYYREVKHNYRLKSSQEPKCTIEGFREYECSNCLMKMKTIIPALGHQCKAKNIARTKSAIRRGATIACVREGCNYEYSFYFQNMTKELEIWEGPPSSAAKDVDMWYKNEREFHFGADETAADTSNPLQTDKEGKRFLLLA